MAFRLLVADLETLYGATSPPPMTRPFELILYEQVAYLASDARRLGAFLRLKKEIGLTPADILTADFPVLREICDSGGIHGSTRALRMRQSATLPAPLDLKALQKHPMVGQPCAEKILLFNHKLVTLAPDSNALRVLIRLGYGQEAKGYSTTYASVAKAVARQLPSNDYAFVIHAHQLLRLHGQELCKRNQPLCPRCPLRRSCPFAKKTTKTIFKE